MRIILQTAVASVLMVGLAHGQAGVFVHQQSTGNNPAAIHLQESGGAFVQQLPADSRVRRTVPSPGTPVYVERTFIVATPAAPASDPVIIYDDVGLVPYGEAKRPALPSVVGGATVILRAPDAPQTLPSIGAGAVLL